MNVHVWMIVCLATCSLFSLIGDVPAGVLEAQAAPAIGTEGGSRDSADGIRDEPMSQSDLALALAGLAVFGLACAIMLHIIDATCGTSILGGYAKHWYGGLIGALCLLLIGASALETPEERTRREALREARRSIAAASEAVHNDSSREEREDCGQDGRCRLNRYWDEAEEVCKREIEALSRFEDVQWTNSFWGSIFSYAYVQRGYGRMSDSQSLYYVGDAVRFSNGHGGYVRKNYRCLYIPTRRDALVTLDDGRLPPRPD